MSISWIASLSCSFRLKHSKLCTFELKLSHMDWDTLNERFLEILLHWFKFILSIITLYLTRDKFVSALLLRLLFETWENVFERLEERWLYDAFVSLSSIALLFLDVHSPDDEFILLEALLLNRLNRGCCPVFWLGGDVLIEKYIDYLIWPAYNVFLVIYLFHKPFHL